MEHPGYEQICAAHRQLTDVRFKLLALVPPVSGTAIGLVSTDLAAFEGSPLPRTIIALLGFVVTLGIVFYDLRNSQIYNALFHRGRALEQELNIPGPFTQKPPKSLRFLFVVQIWHDRALAYIYGAVLGAWIFPIGCGLLWMMTSVQKVPLIAAIVALIAGIVITLELHRLDRQASQFSA